MTLLATAARGLFHRDRAEPAPAAAYTLDRAQAIAQLVGLLGAEEKDAVDARPASVDELVTAGHG